MLSFVQAISFLAHCGQKENKVNKFHQKTFSTYVVSGSLLLTWFWNSVINVIRGNFLQQRYTSLITSLSSKFILMMDWKNFFHRFSFDKMFSHYLLLGNTMRKITSVWAIGKTWWYFNSKQKCIKHCISNESSLVRHFQRVRKLWKYYK